MSLLLVDIRTEGHEDAGCRIFALIMRLKFFVSPGIVCFFARHEYFPIQCGLLPEAIYLVKPTGYAMHHQFNIQQLYALPTLYLCVLYLYQNKQRLVPLTA